MMGNGLVLSLVNQFGDMQGFKILLDLIKIDKDKEFKCPISIVNYAISTFSKLAELGVRPEFISKIYTEISNILEERLLPANFTNADIKETHLEELKGMI